MLNARCFKLCLCASPRQGSRNAVYERLQKPQVAIRERKGFRDTIKTASLLRRQQNSAEDGKGAPAEVTEEDADATAGDAKRQEKGE